MKEHSLHYSVGIREVAQSTAGGSAERRKAEDNLLTL